MGCIMKRKEYTEISFLDLCKYVVSFWKIIVVVIVLSSLIYGGYEVVSSRQEKPTSEVEIKTLTSTLTEESIRDVENAAKIITSYRTIYKTQKDYVDNSIYQNLDPYAINSIVLSYYIDNGYKVSYPIIAEQNKLIPMAQMYASVLQDDDFYENLTKELDLSIDPAYLAEIISVNIGSEDSSFASDSGIFVVTVYANTDELLTSVAEYIKQALSDKTEEVVALYGNHELLLSSEVEKTVIDTVVAEKQQENLNSLTKITASIKTVEAGFSGNQLTYLRYLVHESVPEETNMLKGFIVGAMIGAVLSVLFVVFKYLFSNTIKTVNELEQLIGVASFGELTDNNDFIVAKISNAMKNSESKKLAIVAQVENDIIKELMEQLKMEAILSIDPLNDKNAFEALVSCDSAIFIESLRLSKFDDVVAKKSICEDSQIKILGSILN